MQVISFQSAWKYLAMRKWAIDFGLKSALAYNLPNFTYQSNMPSTTEKDQVPTLETALYFDNKFDLPFGLQFNAGLRSVNFNTQGYNDFANEPRLSINKDFNSNHQLNLELYAG